MPGPHKVIPGNLGERNRSIGALKEVKTENSKFEIHSTFCCTTGAVLGKTPTSNDEGCSTERWSKVVWGAEPVRLLLINPTL